MKAQQLSPLQIEAASAGIAPMRQQADVAWDAYMASLDKYEMVAEGRIVPAPTLAALTLTA